MDRRTVLAGMTGAAMGAAGAANARSPTKEDEDIRLIVSELEASWNAGDAERMYRLATDDIEWVNIMGMYWRGKSQVQAAHHAILTTRYRGVRQALEAIEGIRALGDDAAIAVARWRLEPHTAPDGASIPESRTRMTLVFRRMAGGLRLAHAANIEINSRAAAADPARAAPAG